MRFQVELTAEAEREANAILEWLLSQGAGDTGVRWFSALTDAIESLANSPQRCSFAPENYLFPFEVRQLLYGRASQVYRILFTIERETVYILHIRHGRRQPVRH
jgi:plasmid stabilization system protein ParE